MPYYLSYTLITGRGRRFAEDAADALIAYQELKDIQAGAIIIRDENGVTYSPDRLSVLALPRAKRDRHGEPG